MPGLCKHGLQRHPGCGAKAACNAGPLNCSPGFQQHPGCGV